MPHKTYRSLSIEGLYELLSSSIRDMLTALDTRQDNLIAYKSLRKQVELLLEVIEEKKNETKHVTTPPDTNHTKKPHHEAYLSPKGNNSNSPIYEGWELGGRFL